MNPPPLLLTLLPGPLVQAWHTAIMLWLPPALGCLGLFAVHHLTSGRALAPFDPQFKTGARLLPLLLLLMLPTLLGLANLFPWLDPAYLEDHAIVSAKTGYLDLGFFLLRAIAFWSVWLALAFVLDIPQRGRKRPILAGVGLFLAVVAASFAAYDWLLSLEPAVHIAIIGVNFIGNAALTGYCAAIVLGFVGAQAGRNAFEPQPVVANLLLAFVLFWIYVTFTQYLVIWSGDLPHQSAWYLARTGGGWTVLLLFIIAAKGIVPFLAMALPGLRERAEVILAIAALVLVGHVAQTVWWYAPAFGPGIAFWLLLALSLPAVSAVLLDALAGRVTGTSGRQLVRAWRLRHG